VSRNPPLAARRPVNVDSRPVYQGHVVTLRVDTLRYPNGQEVKREIIDHPGAVVVAALDERGRVAVVEQYRPAVGRELFELPAGTLENGEDPAAAAVRELREETGVEAARWDALGSFYSSPGFLCEELHAYLARDLREVPPQPEDDEDIEVSWMPLATSPVGRQSVMDSKTLATLFLVEDFLRREAAGGP